MPARRHRGGWRRPPARRGGAMAAFRPAATACGSRSSGTQAALAKQASGGQRRGGATGVGPARDRGRARRRAPARPAQRRAAVPGRAAPGQRRGRPAVRPRASATAPLRHRREPDAGRWQRRRHGDRRDGHRPSPWATSPASAASRRGLTQSAQQATEAWAAYVNSTGGICGRQIKVSPSTTATTRAPTTPTPSRPARATSPWWATRRASTTAAPRRWAPAASPTWRPRSRRRRPAGRPTSSVPARATTTTGRSGRPTTSRPPTRMPSSTPP